MTTLNEFVKSAFDNLVAKMKSYLPHLFSHALDGNGVGSKFQRTSVGLSCILDGYWPVTGLPVCWLDVTEKVKEVLLPESLCYQTFDMDVPHELGAVLLENLPEDTKLDVHEEEYKGEKIYSIVAESDKRWNTNNTNVITVIIQNDKDLGWVPACMHPGNPLPTNNIKECQFKDGDVITKEQAIAAGFKTVKFR